MTIYRVNFTDFVDVSPTVANPLLLRGELGFNNLSLEWKIGDGVNYWDDLSPVNVNYSEVALFDAKNTSGSAIAAGKAVMFTGTVGSSGKLTFGLAVSDGTYPDDYMMGITAESIDNNAFGKVVSFGLARGFQTDGADKTVPESWADGDLLYFDAAYPGELTKVKPATPAYQGPIAVVVHATSGSSGSVFVRMKTGERLSTLHDVYLASLSDGQVLQYSSSNNRWENNSIPGNIDGGAAATIFSPITGIDGGNA